MKIKLALVSLLIPTAVFAQAGKAGENAGYQGTTSATQGLGASNPNAGGNQNRPPVVSRGQQYDSLPSSGTPQPVGTVGGPISGGPSGKNPGEQRNSLPPGSGTPQPIGSVGPSGQNPGGQFK